MTEEEAKTKWCPMAVSRAITRIARKDDTEVTVMFVSGDAETPGLGCIASGCMAWKYTYASDKENQKRVTGGYCGLAGKP